MTIPRSSNSDKVRLSVLLQALSQQPEFGVDSIPKLSEGNQDAPVKNISSDSRQMGHGSVFVAVKGGTQDGHEFISNVEKLGASLIVGQRSVHDLPVVPQVPYVKVKDSRAALAFLAAYFYGNPSHSLLMIGITGTSGKTTTSYLLESILKAAGHRVAIIGTIEIRFEDQVIPAVLTTPDAVELQKLLSGVRAQGATAVVMEVSSHALKQKRTDFVAFDGMIFTNLTPEHLDFHPDMEDYFQSKALLFTELAGYSASVGKKPVGAIHKDDPYGQRLLLEIQANPTSKVRVQGFSTSSPQTQLKMTLDGMEGLIQGVEIRSSLTAQFNASNIAAAVTLAQQLGVDPKAIQKGIAGLKGVPGRLEKVENSHGIHVWVDYAHKPDALEKVIQALTKIKKEHRLITVIGCGGDRDRQKRPRMGKTAVESSDYVFITSDNPRTEDPLAIIREILSGIQERFKNFTVEVDRKKAIYEALHFAQKGDLVLIAGKGHETYQILGTQKVHFDDREVVNEAFINYEAWKA